MRVVFDRITVGNEYSRPELASIWGYKGFQAISRGVVTPRDTNKIILFVTEIKQDSQEQYEDKLVGSELQWEGPNDHFAEDRMLNSHQTNDEIHIFYRKRHHSDFLYLGEGKIKQHQLHTSQPSKFIFSLGDFS